jgi:mono/diheme cytochrome c family protein
MKAGVCVVLRAFLFAGAVLAFSNPDAIAQQGGGSSMDAKAASAFFEQGRQLYDANCVACHQAGGLGTPPSIPALAGNNNLKDLQAVVRTIRLGRGPMLAFPQLTATEIAAVTTYVRNAWGNKFGSASADQVTAMLAGLPKTDGAKVSVWSGVYTAAQNERGEELYAGACAQCHGLQLNGAGQPDQPPSPAIARATFLRKWAGQTVAALFVYIHTKMPPEYPGTLTEQQSIDAIAHMFAVSKIPAGAKELPTDRKALENIVIETQPK